ncbi:MAG: TetR/AcrR family transcriptional regulator [Clostridiaceae bacterium]|nr:TetR/AcrR family transcriptional regulator [Clostridiaceae bacterium]
MGTITEKKRQKKEALLEAAFLLFTEKGVDNTSVSQIVQKAKMAKGTFYLYFKDKYEIRDYLISHHANRIFGQACQGLSAWLSDHTDADFEEMTIYLVNHVLDLLSENPELLRFISKNLSWGIFSGVQVNQMYLEIFDSVIKRSGKHYRNQILMIYMIVELVNATCYNVILYGTPVKLEKLRGELCITVRSIVHQFEVK